MTSLSHHELSDGLPARRIVLIVAAISICLVATSAAMANDAVAAVTIPTLPPKTVDYLRFRYGLLFAGMAWNIAAYILAIRLRVGPRLRDATDRRARRTWVRHALFFAALSLLFAVWELPLGLVGYLHERVHGFATLSPWLWLADHGRGYLIGLLTIPAVWIGYALLRRSPRRWWLWLWAISIPWQIAAVVLRPIFIAPLYNDFLPMRDVALRDRLSALADKAGVRGASVYQVDISKRTTRLNAYVTGIGPSKRIVLWDTTLKALSHDEIAAIMAHELGHYVLGHVWWKLGEGIVGAFVLLWLLSRLYPWAIERWGKRYGVKDVRDIGGLPVFYAVLYLLLLAQTPVESALSRIHEREADRYGLALNGDAPAMARAYVVFVRRDFSDPDPPKLIHWWFGSHPTLRERVATAREWRSRRVEE